MVPTIIASIIAIPIIFLAVVCSGLAWIGDREWEAMGGGRSNAS